MYKNAAVITFFVVLVLQSCRFESKRNVSTSNEVFVAEDYIGIWVNESENKEIISEDDRVIYKMNLKKEHKAEVEIQDTTGFRIINGNWEFRPNLIAGVAVKVDLVLTFDRDAHHREKLMLSIQKDGKQVILKSHKSKFKKAN
ncbi:hypothetical protein [Hwangdonia sp.]|uniref:hypothetical protein n=1 Tax=Hwangdonia sp. TaxID=1883432 RepID=UPI003AB5A14D